MLYIIMYAYTYTPMLYAYILFVYILLYAVNNVPYVYIDHLALPNTHHPSSIMF